MPLYEYVCENCKEKFAILIRSPEEEKGIVCSKCKSHKLTKLFSSFATGGPKESGTATGPCSCGGLC